MANNTVEFILKLNSQDFKAGVDAARSGFKALSRDMETGRFKAIPELVAMDAALADIAKHTALVKTNLVRLGAATLAVGGVAAIATKSYSDFAQKMAEINTLVDATPEKFQALENGVRQAALTMGRSATETAGAIYEIISSGVALEDSVGVVTIATKAAVAGVSDVQSTAKLGLSVINAYGRGVGDLENVYDVLFQTVKDGVTTIPELSQHLGEVLPTAAAVGVRIEEVSAAVATMTKVGIRTPQAVTALNGAIRALAAPAPEAKKRMEELGITWKGLTQTLADIKGLNLSIATMREIIPDIEASKGVLALTNNFEGLQTSIKGMDAAAGATVGAYDKMKDTPQEAFKKFQAAIGELALQLGGLIAQGQPVIEIMTDMVKGFAALPGSIKAAGVAILTFGGGALALGVIIKDVVKVMKAMEIVNALTKASQAAAFIGPIAPAATTAATATAGLATATTGFAASANSAALVVVGLLPIIAAIGATMVVFEGVMWKLNKDLDKAIKQTEDIAMASKTYSDLEKKLRDAGAAGGALSESMRQAKLDLMQVAAAGGDINSADNKAIVAAYADRVKAIEDLNKGLIDAQTALGNLEVQKKQIALSKMTDMERIHAQDVAAVSEAALQERIKNIQSLIEKTQQGLDKATAEQQKYADKIKELDKQRADSAKETQDKINSILETDAARHASAEDRKREIRRKGMSEEEQQADIKKQINEKIAASDDALQSRQAGNIDAAKARAAEALNLASQLSDPAAQIAAIDKTEAAQQAASDAAIAALQAEQAAKDEAIKKEEELTAKKKATADADVASQAAKLAELNALKAEAEKQIVVNIEADIASAKSKIDEIKSGLAELKDKTVTVTIKNQEAHAAGGPVGFKRGGRFPGFGGGDRINVLAEAGEWFINKTAVAKYGDGIFHALNSGSVDKRALYAALSGVGTQSIVNHISAPSGIQKFAAGGSVQTGGTNDIITLQLGSQRLDTIGGRRQVLGFLDTLTREIARA